MVDGTHDFVVDFDEGKVAGLAGGGLRDFGNGAYFARLVSIAEGIRPAVDDIIPPEIYAHMHGGETKFFFDPGNLRGACRADRAIKKFRDCRGLLNEKAARLRA